MSGDRAPGSWDGLAQVVLVAVLVPLVLATAGLALPAEVGARLQHGHWIPVSGSTLVQVSWGWVTHPGNAYAGWPRTDHALLPAPALFGLIVGLESVLFLAISGLGVWLYRLGSGGDATRAGNWASRPLSKSIPRRHRGGL